MGIRRRVARLEAAADVPGNERIGAVIAAETMSRMAASELWPAVVVTREHALELSVVNRARDLVCGVLSLLPFTLATTRGVPWPDPPRAIPPGWLNRPDPSRTRGAWVAAVADDLFFHGWAAARITSRDAEGNPNALKHYRWSELEPPTGHPSRSSTAGGEPMWWRWRPPSGTGEKFLSVNMVTFESPLVGILGSPIGLDIAARLALAARRFASSLVPMGWIEQKAGTAPVSADDLAALADNFASARQNNAIAALNEAVEYHESQLDPSRMQLVEARAYQDAALARYCNVPGFMVGASTPGDSMTYKTALSARWDLIDFGLAPYIGCLTETLSMPDVTPAGQLVGMDPAPFLHATELGAERAAQGAPSLSEVPA